ncbi:MAG TPA: protein-disulfide reductase DsbD family protein [Pirellulaceae bacterium]|nr:protein-disulfide reductase DsbD family protein [Pirellulaceae bacterium]HMO91631.1 protein-disulfide reductase DsbD family protein [Pirellulaceae bacterium]HMP68328.1 protein-disulfide reductase DsbD family protein [Pirellulaceae bacterium]
MAIVSLMGFVAAVDAQTAFFSVDSSNEPKLEDFIKFSAEFQIEQGKTNGVILVTANLAPGASIYALEHEDPTLPFTKLSVLQNPNFVCGKFVARSRPRIKKDETTAGGTVAVYEEDVLFWAPFEVLELTPSAARHLKIELRVHGQMCTTDGQMCFPISDHKVEVKFGGFYEVDDDATR